MQIFIERPCSSPSKLQFLHLNLPPCIIMFSVPQSNGVDDVIQLPQGASQFPHSSKGALNV